MAKRAWLGGYATDPVIGARAFAAVGALTAAHWKPSDGDYRNALASIVKTGSGPISWQHPSSSDIISAVDFDEASLAAAWDSAFPASTSAGNPIARLTVDGQSLAKAGADLQDGLVDTYQKLLSPWMGRLDDTRPGQIAALSFATFDQAGRHDWHWPIRIGLPQQGDPALSEKLNAVRGVRREFMEIVSPDLANTDVVLLSEPEFSALSSANRLPPGLAIVYRSRSGAPSGRLEQIAGGISTPTALIEASQRSMPKFLNEFTDEIAHNKPLDVAIFDAYRTIFNPKGARAENVAPLVLLVPRTNQQSTLGNIQLENRVKEFSDRLERLPGDVVIGVPPGEAKYLGIDKSSRTVDDYRSALSKTIRRGGLDFRRETFGSKGLRSTTKVIESVEEKLSAPDTASPAVGEPFSAFPRLDAPRVAEAEKPFEIEVGFSDVPDPDLPDQTKKITIANARDDDVMLVVVSAENGKIIAPNNARLKLKLDAAEKFTVRPAANCDFVRVSADYFFRSEPVGSIVRTVPIAGRPVSDPDNPANSDLFFPVLNTVGRKALDLVLLVKREEGTRITWQAIAGDKISEPIPVDAGDAKQFAAQLDRDQRGFEYKGFQSHTTVQVTGQTIALLIPVEIQDKFLAPCLKDSSSPPRILILTNEPYIPWELAMLDPSVTGKQDPQYFGAVARIGRWWVAPRMTAPAPNLKVGKFSVVCADSYDIETNKKPLPEAVAERDWLCSKFEAAPVLGRLQQVIDWIKSLPIGPGHLAHFALHGYSSPLANEQLLVLGDGANVTPAVLSGLRLTNRDPRYSMVFLNACQVANAGQTLGQFAGFPGALLAAGTNAVIGPIWEVVDTAAHQLVVDFYQDTLEHNVPVSEALRQIRAKCDPDKDTTTPLAYIFYGHPDLTLQR
jgi:CHAT domain